MNQVLRVCCLLLLVAIPSLVAAQDERQAATQALIAYFGAFVDAVKTGDPAESRNT